MSPYAKIVLSTIRVVAFGAVTVSVALWASDVYLFLSHRPGPTPLGLALKGLPALGGLVLFWKAKSLALSWTRDLE